MKTKILAFAGLILLLISSNAQSSNSTENNSAAQSGSVVVNCTPELSALGAVWASSYNSGNPQQPMQLVSSGQSNATELMFTTRKLTSDKAPSLEIIIGKEVIVPVINSKNPFLTELSKTGVSAERFAKLFDQGAPEWGTLLSANRQTAITLYVSNDEGSLASVAKFLQLNSFAVQGIVTGSTEEVINAIRKDPTAIGFCPATSIFDAQTSQIVPGLKLLPIDKNSNGTLDYAEAIYGDMTQLLRGVWIGKYPKALVNNLYAISYAEKITEGQIALLNWILGSGQKSLFANGYSELVQNEAIAQLNKVNYVALPVPPVKSATSDSGIAILILAGLCCLVLAITLIVRKITASESKSAQNILTDTALFDENSVNVPKGLFYDKTHTWAFMEKDGRVKVGIDDFLQHITGPLTRIQMKKAGESIKKGELLVSLNQNGKQLNVYAPISGVIKEQNEDLLYHSDLMNSAPYADGWIYSIEPKSWTEEIQLMDMAEKYSRWIKTEFSRVKDFIASTVKPGTSEYAPIVLQDGGHLKDGILAEFGPAIWEDFQTNFLDTYK